LTKEERKKPLTTTEDPTAIDQPPPELWQPSDFRRSFGVDRNNFSKKKILFKNWGLWA